MRARKGILLGIAALAAMPSATQVQAAQSAPAGARGAPLARASFIATMNAEFGKLDANGDSFVSRAELEAHQQRTRAAEQAERARAAFARIDADRNGQISVAEFTAANAPSPKKVDVTGIMGRLDTNRDEKVTLIEYRTLTLATFDRLDADKDGFVSTEEQKAGGLAK